MLDVVRLATVRYQILWLLDDGQKREVLGRLDAMPAPMRTLVWLAVIESELTRSLPSDPPATVFDGQFKGRMAQALEDAGLARKAAVFRAATAATPEPAPDASLVEKLGKLLVPLAEDFGDRGDLDRDILAFIATHPDAARWCEEQRDALSDEDRLRALETGLARNEGRGTAAGMKSWPAAYRTIALADSYVLEVGNGGVHQYFLNSSGDVAPEAAEAMDTLGLPKQSAVIRQGMALFPAPYPSARDQRFRSFDHEGTTDWDNKLEALTEDADDGTAEPAMIAYAKREAILPR